APEQKATWRSSPMAPCRPPQPRGPVPKESLSTVTYAPCTPHGSASTPPAASPCTTTPDTPPTGSTTGTTPPPRAPTLHGRSCMTSDQTMTPAPTCQSHRSPHASTDTPSPAPATPHWAPPPRLSPPTHC